MLQSNTEPPTVIGPAPGHGSACDWGDPPLQPECWWDEADVRFRSVAVAFVAEMDLLATQLENGSLAVADLQAVSHQIRGAAGVFLADATAAAAARLEDASGLSSNPAVLAEPIRLLAAALRYDARRMRSRLRMDARGCQGGDAL